MVDDSIVRGTTQASLVRLLREQGQAAEVHVRITSPPIRWPCFLGIDIPDPEELIAHKQDEEKICESIDADSLGYLAKENLVTAIGQSADHLCLGCFTHSYPIDVQLRFDKFLLERPQNHQTAMVFPREDMIERSATTPEKT
jgi:amidophosphoribosyltransferase